MNFRESAVTKEETYSLSPVLRGEGRGEGLCFCRVGTAHLFTSKTVGSAHPTGEAPHLTSPLSTGERDRMQILTPSLFPQGTACAQRSASFQFVWSAAVAR